ncbi:MAG: carboxylesterase family protein [Gemmatimonadota bacterium]|nr:carboxylesterase family protein [Gemmatimonadota bacterium]
MRPYVFFALAALIPMSLASSQRAVPARAGAPHVRTVNGTIAGMVLPSGVDAFRGVPFAAPPVRDLRWRPPQPVKSWQGVRPADRFADQCMQARVFGDMTFRNSGVSEDCLYLNVWTPEARSGAALPVLFYIYGGGFIAGDGSEPRYDGESMAKRGIVVVTISHRLGIFGFFSHPELAAESPEHASGNYGLMDQTAALRWVRDNIAAFGGDPKRVTIAGESAGSFSVSAQMASPLAKDLFAGAIGESGAFFSTTIPTPPHAQTESNGAKFGTAVGVPSLAALRALSATEVLEASGKPGVPRFGPNVDGCFLPEAPASIFAAGRQARVPLLAGWNSEESNARALVNEAPSPENAKAQFAKLFGDRAMDAERVFPVSTAAEAQQSLTDLASDRFIGYSTWKWLDVHARTSGKPVYRYFYAHPRPPLVASMGNARPGLAGGIVRGGAGSAPPPATGAVHSSEIEYALGNLPLNPVFAWTPDDHKVSATMQSYFENFIKTGNPNGSGLPLWPAGGVNANGEVQRIRIDVDTRAELEPRARYLFLDAMSGRPR